MATEHIIAEFRQCDVKYGVNSRDVSPNPDYHPPIRLTSTGKFLDEQGNVIPKDQVPESVLAKAAATRKSPTLPPRKGASMDMDQAMIESGVADTEPDPVVKKKRGRPRKAQIAA